MNKKTNHGFTLIETLVYLGLFALVMIGIVAMAYNVFELSDRTETRAMLTAEGNFILGKISWAMNGATAVSTVASPPSLSVTRDTSPSPVVFDITGSTNLELKRGASPALVLNNSNIQVQNLVFTHTGSGPNPEYMTASFDLFTKTPDGKSLSQSFTVTKYLRK